MKGNIYSPNLATLLLRYKPSQESPLTMDNKECFTGEVNMSIYFHHQGWIDGYLNKALNPFRLGNFTQEDAKAYREGFHEGQYDSLVDSRDSEQNSEVEAQKEEPDS